MTKIIHTQCISLRAVIVGIILCFIIGIGEPYGVCVIQGSIMAADYSTGAAIFLFFALVFIVNTILKLINRRLSLDASELMVVYIMMVIACAIPSWGFSMGMIGLIAGSQYYASPTNRWGEVIFSHLPKWITVNDSKAIQGFYEGLPKGASIPWSVWLQPLFYWGVFILSMYFLTICIVVILRKQWVENEKLLFPLTRLPLEMVSNTTKKGILPPFFKNRVMWFGFFIPFIFLSINALHHYFHIIPYINLTNWTRAFHGTVSIPIMVSFEVIGLAYLLSLDISFSLWFFALIAFLQTGFCNITGISIGPSQPYGEYTTPVVTDQAAGALIFYVLSGLWFARAHLKAVFLKAFKNKKEIDDREEIISYRVAVFGLIFCLVLCGIWLMASGLKFLSMVVFLFFTLITFIALTKIIAQAGIGYLRQPVIPCILTMNFLGTNAIGPSGLAALGMTHCWAADLRTTVMGSTSNSLKMAQERKIMRRGLLFPIILAIIVSLVSSIWIILLMGYKHGAINFGGWGIRGLPSWAMTWTKAQILHPRGIAKAEVGFVGIGALFMALLTFMRNRFLWWPLHPIGLVASCSLPIMYRAWFSIFLASLFKFFILKYGGYKIYSKSIPFFLGLILGVFTTAGLWLIISGLTKISGIFLISVS